MLRCEGYYKLENRRCDRDAERYERAADGGLYLVCAYHRRQAWTTRVAHWHGEQGMRRTTPVALSGAPVRETDAAA